MCKANKKLLGNYLKSQSTKDYIEALSNDTGIPVSLSLETGIPVSNLISVIPFGITLSLDIPNGISSLLVELKGTPDGDASLQGTYGHHLVAIDLARWISAEFAVAANKVIWAVMQGDFKALTQDAQKAKDELDAALLKIRLAGIATRRSFTDAIKDWYERNPGGTSRPIGGMIATVTNDTYKALWGMDAKQIENVLGCNRNQLRNHLSGDCLKVLDRAEARVIEFIDDDNIKPSEAVAIANIKKTKVKISHK